jgi:hypothetical protein
MRRILFLLLIVAGSALAWYFVFKDDKKPEDPKLPPLVQSKYSQEFNNSVGHALENYYSMTEAFVSWDSSKVNSEAASFKQKLDSLKLDELKDTTSISITAKSAIDNAKNDSEKILSQPDLEAKRRAYQSLSSNLYDFLRTIRFDASKIYLQECPMAFNDTETAQWLSAQPQIRNPYLGLHHPKYGKGMLVCGETRDSLAYGVAR